MNGFLVMHSLLFFEISDVQIEKHLFWYFLIVAALILGTVIFCIAYFSRKYKVKDEEEIPEQNHGNRKFEIAMIFLATTITALFLVLAVNAMNSIQDIPQNPI